MQDKTIHTVIIDDEDSGRNTLSGMLKKYCPEIDVRNTADGVATGVELILNSRPDLVFLDIQMGDGTGFDLLQQVKSIPFKLVIVSAFDEFALQAFQYSAINYLMKPVNPVLLVETVSKVVALQADDSMRAKFHSMIADNHMEKVALPSQQGIRFVSAEEILRCESSGNYTVVHLHDGEQIAVTKNLKHFSRILVQKGFFRCHHSHLVNLNFVREYLRGEGGTLILQDSTEIEVSRRRKLDLLRALSLEIS